MLHCSEPGCDAEMPAHAKNKIRGKAWFFGKGGDVWCPEHLPEFVAKFRQRVAEKRKKS